MKLIFFKSKNEKSSYDQDFHIDHTCKLCRPHDLFIDNINKPLVYRVHLWSKNANIDRIIIEELGEHGFGLYSHIILDRQMNIYVETRYYIRKWLASTNYTRVMTVTGMRESNEKFSNQLNDPRGLYIENDLTMCIVDLGNHKRIQKWFPNANQAITLDSNLLYPYGITQDCNGNIYYRSVIYQLNIVTNQRTCFIGDDSSSQNEKFSWNEIW